MTAPQAGDITDCYRCSGQGCAHCGGSGRLEWIAYGHSRPAAFAKLSVGVDWSTKPDTSALAGMKAGEVRYVHTLPAGAVVTFTEGRALVVHPGGPPYWVDMITGDTEALETDMVRPYYEDAAGRRWLLDGSGDVA
jgi:hypothetical protein